MDATSDDRDIKALKHSNALLEDVDKRIPELLWDTTDGKKRLRPRVKAVDYHHIVRRLESFQEFPQLLDPILAGCMEHLTSAFSTYLVTEVWEDSSSYDPEDRSTVNTLAALGHLLYGWMKVRGPKVVLRFLYNDPKWLEPMLGVFEESAKLIGTTDKSTDVLDDVVKERFEVAAKQKDTTGLSWHLRYVTLMWISHLLYTPFDLVTIADEPAVNPPVPLAQIPALPDGTPEVAKRALNIACCCIHSAGKDREGASAAIVRLVVRKDVYGYLLDWFIDWVADVIRVCVKGQLREDDNGVGYVYLLMGLLGALSGILASGERSMVGSPDLLQKVYENIMRELYIDESGLVAQNAMLRKTLCKLLRNLSYLYLPVPGQGEFQDGPPEEVEEMIDQLLRLLDDRDSLVRYAASKSLSLVALRLSAADRSQIFEAVIDLYDSDVLYPNRALTKLDLKKRHQKDLSQVSVHLWHGLTLTVATFLRFHAATMQMLPKVLDCIVTALAFEQRKATFATGGNVRDAACYAAWSLARNYKTEEMMAEKPAPPYPDTISLPQLLAQELVNAACLDPVGNIRRGASAALQELVGRHPNMIKDGISLVQVVDYSAVALQSRAGTEIASKAAVLGGTCYWDDLINGMIDDWRGIGLQESAGRIVAGKGIGILAKIGVLDLNRREDVWVITKNIIKRYGVGSSLDIEVRHGSWYALADIIFALINELEPHDPKLLTEILLEMKEKTGVFDIFNNVKPRDFVHPVLKPEMTCEAAAYLITALSDAAKIICAQGHPDLPVPLLRRYLCVIDSALERWEENVTNVAVYAAERFFLHMSGENRAQIVKLWLGKSKARTRRILVVKALGAVFRFFKDEQEWPRLSSMQQDIVDGILVISKSPHIEMRVAAISALADGIFPEGVVNEQLLQMLHRALVDYSVDSRGDVGSWARIEAIRAVLSLHAVQPLDIHTPDTIPTSIFHKIIGLSAEKLDRVRIKACDAMWKITSREPRWADHIFGGITPESSFWVNWDEYFETTVRILGFESVRQPYLEGYATSAGAGSDSVMRSSTRAMQKYLASLPAYPIPDSDVALSDIVQAWIDIVQRGIDQGDDRVVVPSLAMLGGWFESGLMEKLEDGPLRFQDLFSLTQKAHFKSSNVAKLTGAVKIYNGLAAIKTTRTSSMKKLVTMLLHPFPKIRTMVAETLYLIISLEGDQEETEILLTETNWGDQPKQLKEVVEEIKTTLQI